MAKADFVLTTDFGDGTDEQSWEVGSWKSWLNLTLRKIIVRICTDLRFGRFILAPPLSTRTQ